MITIHNLKDENVEELYDFLIDKRTPLGNPFWPCNEADRDNACDAFDRWARKTKNAIFNRIIDDLVVRYKMHGRLRLFCHCVPKRCHGETIKALIKERVENV